MAIRNCAEIGENLQKIMTRLIENDKLVKLLYYEDMTPLADDAAHPALSPEQKHELIFNQLIKIVPCVLPRTDSKSTISIKVARGINNSANDEFRDLQLTVEIFVPWTNWIICNSNLRPFAILGEIQKSLNGKTINGLGEISGGDFQYKFGTDEISCYEAYYNITTYA